MTKLEVKEVQTKSDLTTFINLPWKLYKDDPYWVPPLKLTVKELFDSKHPFYETAEQINYLAYRNNTVVGRISAVWPKSHNQKNNDHLGFFGFFESIDDLEVSKALLTQAQSWLKAKGTQRVQGPLNPSTNYECGLLIEGFQDPPQIMMTYNPKSYIHLIENSGFSKAKDLLAYKRDLHMPMPDIINRIADRAEKKSKITYRFINKKKFDEEVQKMLDIYNDAWEDNWGFIPMTSKEFRHTAKDLKSIIKENMIIFAEVDGENAGFIVGLPDLNQVLKKIPNGKLLPFGFFKLLNYKKHVTRFRVPTLGVKSQFRKIGLDTLLYKKLREETISEGYYNEVECSWVLEDNLGMNRPLVTMGAKLYKKYRIYEKLI